MFEIDSFIRRSIKALYMFHEPPVGVGAFSQVFRATNKETHEVDKGNT